MDPESLPWGVPILGICYGCQLIAYTLDGAAPPSQDDSASDYGKTVPWYDTA